jgi:hypothetical protein
VGIRQLSRWSAFVTHLLISGGVALVAVSIVFFVWYPQPLQKAVGVTEIFLLLLLVDVVLGPFLTLAVFKPTKPSLKFDLTIIATLQVGALLYGLHTVYIGRPAWIVFAKDRFEIVRAVDIDQASSEKAKSEYKNAPPFGPKTVGVKPSSSVSERNEMLLRAAEGGADLQNFPHLYVSFEDVRKEIIARAMPFGELPQFNPAATSEIEKIRGDYPSADGFVPVKAKAVDMTALVNRTKGDVIAIVDLRPWN